MASLWQSFSRAINIRYKISTRTPGTYIIPDTQRQYRPGGKVYGKPGGTRSFKNRAAGKISSADIRFGVELIGVVIQLIISLAVGFITSIFELLNGIFYFTTTVANTEKDELRNVICEWFNQNYIIINILSTLIMSISFMYAAIMSLYHNTNYMDYLYKSVVYSVYISIIVFVLQKLTSRFMYTSIKYTGHFIVFALIGLTSFLFTKTKHDFVSYQKYLIVVICLSTIFTLFKIIERIFKFVANRFSHVPVDAVNQIDNRLVSIDDLPSTPERGRKIC